MENKEVIEYLEKMLKDYTRMYNKLHNEVEEFKLKKKSKYRKRGQKGEIRVFLAEIRNVQKMLEDNKR